MTSVKAFINVYNLSNSCFTVDKSPAQTATLKAVDCSATESGTDYSANITLDFDFEMGGPSPD